jgi:hypothetical protein
MFGKYRFFPQPAREKETRAWKGAGEIRQSPAPTQHAGSEGGSGEGADMVSVLAERAR